MRCFISACRTSQLVLLDTFFNLRKIEGVSLLRLKMIFTVYRTLSLLKTLFRGPAELIISFSDRFA